MRQQSAKTLKFYHNRARAQARYGNAWLDISASGTYLTRGVEELSFFAA